LIKPVGRLKWVALFEDVGENPLIPHGTIFFDWCNVVSKLKHAFKYKTNVLIVGPAGIGKTASVRKTAELLGKPLRIVNFSLRTREHNFVGRLDTLPNGNLYFKEGPLVKAMKNGEILVLDEANTIGDPAVHIRLDEALDFRRELNVEGERIKAHEDFFAVATINPLDRYHPGTRELPGQLLSRFPVRIYMTYPDSSTEYKIVKLHVPEVRHIASQFMEILFAIKQLRESDLPYLPSVRESIALARLLTTGINQRSAIQMVLVDVYGQWGQDAMRQVVELLKSRGLQVGE